MSRKVKATVIIFIDWHFHLKTFYIYLLYIRINSRVSILNVNRKVAKSAC